MDTENIKIKSFEYIVYEMILWYVQLHKNNTIKFFEEKNVFSLDLVQHYPFFVFVAADTDDRKYLLSLFDSFAFEDHGIIEKTITEDILKLNCFDINKCKTCIKRNSSFSAAFYLDNMEMLLDKMYSYFEEFAPAPVIKRSIEQLKKSNIRFIDHDFQLLSLFAKRHYVWLYVDIMKKYFKEDFVLPQDKFLLAKSIYSSDLKLVSPI